MNEGLIPKRYAKALFMVAKERNEEKDIYLSMKSIDQSFISIPQLNETLNNPYISASDKAGLILSAAGVPDQKSGLLNDFIKLLTENRRLGMIRLIACAFVDIYREENKIFRVDVESAAPLGEAEESRLKSLIGRHLGDGTMEYSHSVNPSLIGGFTVSVGNERIDASVSNELKQLRLNLISK